MKTKLILIGGGGHCKVCIDVIEQTKLFEIAGILDLTNLLGTKVLDYSVIGTDQDIAKYVELGYSFLITVGQIKSAALRKKLFSNLIKSKANIATVISPSAYVSKYSKIGANTIVMHGAIVNADVNVGQNCIINTLANVEHEVKIGNYCHISTGAILNGQVNIGDNCFIGSGAVLANNISIATGTIIGAGAVVLKSVKKPGIYVGNPAKFFGGV